MEPMTDRECMIATIERFGELPRKHREEDEEPEEIEDYKMTVLDLWRHVKIGKPSNKRMVLRIVREDTKDVLRYDFDLSKVPSYSECAVKAVYADADVSHGVNGEPMMYPVLICEI